MRPAPHTQPSPEAIWADPTWLPVDVDLGANTFSFVPMTAAGYRASTFLDGRRVAAAPHTVVVPWADLGPPPAPSPLRFVFHTAYCGSTLLARCLEAMGSLLVLREPPIFTALARLLGTAPASEAQALFLAAALSARSYDANAAPLIKLNSNAVVLMPALAKLAWGRGLFLSADLESTILAYLRNPQRGAEAKQKLALLRRHPLLAGTASAAVDPSFLDDAETAALLWLLHRQGYEQVAASAPELPIASLSTETLLAEPKLALLALARFFELPVDAATVDAVLASQLVGQHAKNPERAYDRQSRDRDLEDLRARHAGEVAHALGWVDSLAKGARQSPMGRALPLTQIPPVETKAR